MYILRGKKIDANSCVYPERISGLYLPNWIFDEDYGSLINSKQVDVSLHWVKDDAMSTSRINIVSML